MNLGTYARLAAEETQTGAFQRLAAKAVERLDPEVFEKAADIIDNRGLAHGTYEATDQSVCAMGALRYATGYWGNIEREPWEHEAGIQAYQDAQFILSDFVGGSIPDWNDARDEAEVTNTLRKVAEEVRSRKP